MKGNNEMDKENERMRVVTLRITESQYAVFKAMADFFKMSLSELFRDLLETGLGTAEKMGISFSETNGERKDG